MWLTNLKTHLLAKLKDWLDANLCKGKLKEGICSIETLCGKLREAVSQRCSVKKVFLKILQNSQENTGEASNFIKKRDSGTGFSLWILQNF